jgi:DNA polymerase-3 subunit alpha
MTGVIDLLIFPEAFARLEQQLLPDAAVIVKGKTRQEESGHRIAVQDLTPLEQTLPAPQLVVRLDLTQVEAGVIDKLLALLERRPGPAPVRFELEQARDYRVRLDPRQPLRVQPDEELLAQVRALCGESAVSLLT